MFYNSYRLILTFVLASFLLSCGQDKITSDSDEMMVEDQMSDAELDDLSIDWSSCAQWSHDLTGETLTTYPDDQFTISDEATVTGLKLNLADRPWTEGSSAFVKRLTTDISTLDGWGINAGIVLRFKGADLSSLAGQINSVISESNQEPLQTAVLYMEDPSQAEPPHFPAQVPVKVRFFNEGKHLVLDPLRPLKSATRYGFILPAMPPTEKQEACIAPSEVVKDLIEGESELAQRRRQLIGLANLDADQVAALTVFTTQSALHQSIEIAQFIREQNYSWNEDLDCDIEGAYYHCTRSFDAQHFQDSEGVINGPIVHQTYPIKVHFWRPRNRADETPAILFGHGIGGDINNVYILDEIIEGMPITRIAIDAVAHGEHPMASSGASFQVVLDFFALDIGTQTLQALKARDNFRQSTYDKLQLVELLHQDPDMNADGRSDLSLDKLGYYGLSLGGIMGVELLSLEPRIDLGLLAVPGARLVSVLTDGSVIGDFKSAIYLLVGGKEVFDGLTPLAQVLLDAADPGTYAPYIYGEKRSWTTNQSNVTHPHLLMQMAMNDEIVPNTANAALARAFNLPHLKQVAQPISLLDQVDGPLAGNLAGSTAALFQFDRVTTGPQVLSPSDHMNVPAGREGRHQARQFLLSWLSANEEFPIILDPYEAFSIPALSQVE